MTSLGPLAERTFAAVIFDNDGTLTDSTDSVIRSWVTWAHEFDVDPKSLAGFHGVPAADIVAAVAPHAPQAAALDRINELEVNDLDGVVALPGAVDAVHDSQPHTAIATSASAALATARLDAADIPDPAVLITIDDVTCGKPAPDPFLAAAAAIGADPAQCLVVEDAPAGVAAARAAGCAVLAVTTTTPAAELPADAVVATLADVEFVATSSGVRLRLR